MKTKTLLAMPPEGEDYGFPKPFPSDVAMTPNDRIKWFKDHNYPQELIDDGLLNFTKYYEEE